MLQKRIKTLLVLLLILFIVYEILCLFARPVPDHPYFNPDKFLVIAHRGGRSLGPENTLYTYRKAVKLGVDVLEMDVRSTSDGQLIILHADTVAQTTNATGPVENSRWRRKASSQKCSGGHSARRDPMRVITRGHICKESAKA